MLGWRRTSDVWMETAGSPLLKLPGFVGRAFDPHTPCGDRWRRTRKMDYLRGSRYFWGQKPPTLGGEQGDSLINRSSYRGARKITIHGQGLDRHAMTRPKLSCLVTYYVRFASFLCARTLRIENSRFVPYLPTFSDEFATSSCRKTKAIGHDETSHVCMSRRAMSQTLYQHPNSLDTRHPTSN